MNESWYEIVLYLDPDGQTPFWRMKRKFESYQKARQFAQHQLRASSFAMSVNVFMV